MLYCGAMKRRDLAARLTAMGWRLVRQGGSHEIWTDGESSLAVPRHREINELTAKGILKKAGRMKGKEG